MNTLMMDALKDSGYTFSSKKDYYTSLKDVPRRVFMAVINDIVWEKVKSGVLYSSEMEQEILSKLNQIVSDNSQKKSVSSSFIKKLFILENKKENIEIRNFLLKYKDKVILNKGYGLAIAYDRFKLCYSIISIGDRGRTDNHEALAYLEEGIESGVIPFICLKVNTFTGFNIESVKYSKPNYLFSAYGYNILNNEEYEEHLKDWYAKFGRKAVSNTAVYHVCRCNSNKFRNQWYLMKAREEIRV